MRDFKKERGKARQVGRMLVGVSAMAALGLGAGLCAQAAWGMYQKFSEASQADAQATAELADLRIQYATVSSTVELLNTRRGEEAALRERYGAARPGEGVIAIVREKNEAEERPSGKGFFESLWQALFVW